MAFGETTKKGEMGLEMAFGVLSRRSGGAARTQMMADIFGHII